ncbi:MAG: hypothetical protein AAB758_02630 [Patescibacteria group bacterium]
MLEARSFVENFDKAKKILEDIKAVYKGEYIIHDIVFSSTDKSKTLTDELLRLRVISKNIWNEKNVILVIKNTEVKEVGKSYTVPLKMQFDTEAEARKYIDENLLDKFEYCYEFGRTGWQYDIGEDQLDLEDIEGLLSIEAKSKTEDGLKKLVKLFEIEDVIKGPSVIKVKELLKR